MLLDRGRRLPRSSEVSTYLSDAPADRSQEGLKIASGVSPGLSLSEQGFCFVGGTVTLDDVSFTTKSAIHRGVGAITPYRCVALLDTGSPQTFIRRDVLDRMILVGTTSVACERPWNPRSWVSFGESAPLPTSISFRLSLQFLRDNEPT